MYIYFHIPQVLSHSVAAGIWANVVSGNMPEEATHTATFCEMWDRSFNIFNSLSLKTSKPFGQAFNDSMIPSLHAQLAWIKTVKPKNKSGDLPCLAGWRMACECIELLWKDLKTENNLKFLLTGNSNILVKSPRVAF